MQGEPLHTLADELFSAREKLSRAAQDEPFHVPQTQRYCRGDFAHWDPKITTFPGLYAAGAAYGRALRALSQLWRLLPLAAVCNTSALRSLNVLLAGACFAVTRALCQRLHPRQGGDYATLFVRIACQLKLLILPYCAACWRITPGGMRTPCMQLHVRQAQESAYAHHLRHACGRTAPALHAASLHVLLEQRMHPGSAKLSRALQAHVPAAV